MMNTNAVEKRVADVIQGVLGTGAELVGLDPKKPLKDVNAIDSLSALRIMVALENEFKLKFDAADLERAFHSVETLSRYVEAKTSKGTVQ